MLKIKLEVDTEPPLGFSTEEKLLLQPFSFYVKCFCLADLFAGKMHAVLFQEWQKRVKGRYLFDLEWYVRKGIPLRLEHLERRARQSGHWTGDHPITEASLHAILAERIQRLDVTNARLDIERFIADPQPLAIWSTEYFQALNRGIQVA